jgi:DNA-binding NtrC family response regulator
MMTDRNTVLIVEDDDGLRYAFRKAVEREGFHVVEAARGDDAVRILNEVGDTFAFVVLDMIVPKVHGSSIIFHIANTLPALPVAAVTGYPDRVMFADPADRHVVKAIFEKPVAPEDVATFIKSQHASSIGV